MNQQPVMETMDEAPQVSEGLLNIVPWATLAGVIGWALLIFMGWQVRIAWREMVYERGTWRMVEKQREGREP